MELATEKSRWIYISKKNYVLAQEISKPLELFVVHGGREAGGAVIKEQVKHDGEIQKRQVGNCLEKIPIGFRGDQTEYQMPSGHGKGRKIPEPGLVRMGIFLVNCQNVGYNGVNGNSCLKLFIVTV